MLASLLPGLRDVRAPLAAGFIWMVALWFLLEPHWPEADADGVIGSANRLLANLNLLGQGVVLSFTAYVLGSFSVFLFSGFLRDRLRTSVDATGRLSGLSPLGRTSLQQVAVDGRHRLEEALTLSGYEVRKVLDDTSPVEAPRRWKRRNWSLPQWRRRRPWEEGRWWQVWVSTRKYGDLTHMGPSPPRDPDDVAEDEIRRRVLKDLPTVAAAQLLGKETEVFSAVDRNEAEVDFRIALVPAITGLAQSLAVASLPERPLPAAACVLVGALAALALMLDAARQRREANELILSLMEHGRIDPPSVERAASAAFALADQAPGKVLARQGEETRRALRSFMDAVAKVGDSSVSRGLEYAKAASQKASEESRKLDDLVGQYERGPTLPVLAQAVLLPLDNALRVMSQYYDSPWQGQLDGPESDMRPGPPAGDIDAVNQLLTQFQRDAAEAMGAFVRRVREAVAQAAARDAANAAVGTGERLLGDGGGPGAP